MVVSGFSEYTVGYSVNYNLKYLIFGKLSKLSVVNHVSFELPFETFQYCILHITEISLNDHYIHKGIFAYS